MKRRDPTREVSPGASLEGAGLYNSRYTPKHSQANTEAQNDIYSAYGDFLSGNKLDVAGRFSDVSLPVVVDRIEYLRQKCTRKKILHIGCLDHPEIIRERMNNGTWLHESLSSVSEVCVGIDVNSEGYDLVVREFGVGNIQLLDLSKPLNVNDLTRLKEIQWDFMVCPEILEHITNHQQFLENLVSISGSETTLIITVPNAFQFANFVNSLRGFESINSDHKYWFTFYTLSRTLADNGWKPRRLIYYDGPMGMHWMEILCRLASRMSRVFCAGLIVEATLED